MVSVRVVLCEMDCTGEVVSVKVVLDACEMDSTGEVVSVRVVLCEMDSTEKW